MNPPKLKTSHADKESPQKTADRLSLPLDELQCLAAHAGIEAIASHLKTGNSLSLPLELTVSGASLPAPDSDQLDKTAGEFIPPAQIGKAQALADKSGWSLTAIGQFALAVGLRQLEEEGSEILGLPAGGR